MTTQAEKLKDLLEKQNYTEALVYSLYHLTNETQEKLEIDGCTWTRMKFHDKSSVLITEKEYNILIDLLKQH